MISNEEETTQMSCWICTPVSQNKEEKRIGIVKCLQYASLKKIQFSPGFCFYCYQVFVFSFHFLIFKINIEFPRFKINIFIHKKTHQNNLTSLTPTCSRIPRDAHTHIYTHTHTVDMCMTHVVRVRTHIHSLQRGPEVADSCSGGVERQRWG